VIFDPISVGVANNSELGEPIMFVIRLSTVQYSERLNTGKAWDLTDLTFGQINLIVGTNSTGKTRTINVINSLAQLISPIAQFRTQNCNYDVLFDNNGEPLRYVLRIDGGKVTAEEFYVGAGTDNRKLFREPGGVGEIYAKEEGRLIRFKPPENELAVVVRRDSLQHPYLEPLYNWAESVRHYSFGSHLGRDRLTAFVKDGPTVNDRDTNQVVAIFRNGSEKLGQPFIDAIIRDMHTLDYPLEDVMLSVPETLTLPPNALPTEVFGIAVKERGIEGIVDQIEISQGMFRALSIIIQVNYSQIANRANCILIDDIGEGLDFGRSQKLIELLRCKAKQSSFQLIMTTNDRFVMDHVPLEEWSVLQRQGAHVHVRTYQNSKDIFEEFKFTGLSNFSFLEMDFISGVPKGATVDE
jgi:predicted ATPase